MVYIYAGVFIDIFEFHLVSEKKQQQQNKK